MKKLILTTIAALLFSCSSDEPCQCKEVMQWRPDYSNEWRTSTQEFPTNYNCSSDGYTYPIEGYFSHATNTNVERRRKVVCK